MGWARTKTLIIVLDPAVRERKISQARQSRRGYYSHQNITQTNLPAGIFFWRGYWFDTLDEDRIDARVKRCQWGKLVVRAPHNFCFSGVFYFFRMITLKVSIKKIDSK